MLLDDFLSEYWIREETLEGIWHWVGGEDRGLLHLAGPPGTGKSWLLRGLAVNAQERGFIPILVERLPGESAPSLLWKLVDHTEYLLDVDGEYLRLLVSQALYAAGPGEAWKAYLTWLGNEMQGHYLVMLDGLGAPLELSALPAPFHFPEGVFVVTAGNTDSVSRHGANFFLDSQSAINRRELLGFIEHRLPAASDELTQEILERSQGNWRVAAHYAQLLELGGQELPEPDQLIVALLDRFAEKVGKPSFRTVHLDILLILAIAQVPVNSDLLRAWGVQQDKLAFALFELRMFLTTDGEGSQMEALFTGEHYSLSSSMVGAYLLENPAWRDRLSEVHRRVIQAALDLRHPRWQNPNPTDEEFYALCFAEHHLRQSGRTGDLQRLAEDPLYAERCWQLSRAARDMGYEEIALNLIVLAAEKYEQQGTTTPTEQAQLAEVQSECCSVLTQLGRYSDAAKWGERAMDLLRDATWTRDPQYEPLLTHCQLCLADPYLFMGSVEPAREMFADALKRARAEQPPDHAKVIHALRGLARSSRALGVIPDALQHGTESLTLARRLTHDEGEEWANYLFDLLMEQCDYLRVLSETRQEEARERGDSPGAGLEVMTLRWEALRCCREAAALYERFGWPQDQELASLYLEESMMLFEVEKWGEAEERLSRAIAIYRGLADVHPGEFASLEYLRSQALALMNRIGEASHTLSQLMTPEMLESLEISERALVLFFRAKVLTHQGQLSESAEVLQEALGLYESAVAQGAPELRGELLSAKIYMARVTARRGRLVTAQRQCRQAAVLLRRVHAAGGPAAFLEEADLLELEAWLLLHRKQPEEAMERCESALLTLERVPLTESDTDLETEKSVTLVTKAQIQQALGDLEGAVQTCERAVEIESRRAQEGFESGLMWCALHWGSLAKILREVGRLEESLKASEEALSRLQSLPANQQAHLGPQIANLLLEEGQAHLAEGRLRAAMKSLERGRLLLESELPQGKEYLIANLLELYRPWLECHRQLEAQEPQGLEKRWGGFFGAVPWLVDSVRSEGKSDFLRQAARDLAEWVEQLAPAERQLWMQQVPRSFLRLPRPAGG